MRRLHGSVLVAAAGASVLFAPQSAPAAPRVVEVVVGLRAPSLADARSASRVLTAASKSARLRIDDPWSKAYVRALAGDQSHVMRDLERRIPASSVRWRYRVTLNALAVVLPASRIAAVRNVAGVQRVYPTLAYRTVLDRSVPEIGVGPDVLGTDFGTAGNGIKIAVIDDGIDARHPFFDPAGYATPPGFPRGILMYTSPKVIAARAFAPPGATWPHAAKPFDPRLSEHGTHVAGIAAGNAGVEGPGAVLAGVAPRALLGNYKVLTVPDAARRLFGGSPEIAAGIESAVRDGMDVINLSIGAPEVEPSRDVVAEAVDGAASAGVIVVASAGNDYVKYGAGSIGSPAAAARAIAVAAISNGRNAAERLLWPFSSGGPTPLSLRAKPDVSAPGWGIVSSIPVLHGTWRVMSGTSMAAPHVAGAAALLRQRHPDWSVDEIASALTLTGRPVFADAGETSEAPASRQGGGLIDVRRALRPLLTTAPRTLSFGFLRRGSAASRRLSIADTGGGGGRWTMTADFDDPDPDVALDVPASVDVPADTTLVLRATARARPGELSGFVVLARGGERRRVPFWARVDAFEARDPDATLARTGTYSGTTAARAATSSEYRYPDRAGTASRVLGGPEQIFRVQLDAPAPNVGVAVLARDPGVQVEPRIVAGRPRRLVGYAGLPLNLDPRSRNYEQANLTSAVILPAAGAYDVVFDSRSAGTAGRFRFRFWIGDVTPPRLRLKSRIVGRRRILVLSAADRGSGVDPSSILIRVDGGERTPRYVRRRDEITIRLGRMRRGTHEVVAYVADYQATKDGGQVGRANRARLRARFRIT